MHLSNNPMVRNALSSMSTEQISDYKKLGESMYGSMNFGDSQLINEINPCIEESVAYIEEGIKSGLAPCDLTEDEVNVLTSAFGDEWYLRYGFTKEEVPEVGLSLELKKHLDTQVEKHASEMGVEMKKSEVNEEDNEEDNEISLRKKR